MNLCSREGGDRRRRQLAAAGGWSSMCGSRTSILNGLQRVFPCTIYRLGRRSARVRLKRSVSMKEMVAFLAKQGYWLLFVSVVGRQACLPVPANLLLVAAGAL